MIHARSNDGHARTKFFIIRQKRKGGKEVEKRIEEKVVLLALHACSLTVRPKRELKGVVCSRALFFSFALISASYYRERERERCECFLLFLLLRICRLLFFVVYIDLSIYLSIFLSFFFSFLYFFI
jgi:hypothetical protein